MPEDAAVAALRGKHPLSWYRRLHTRAVWYMTQGDERDLFRALARQEARLDALAPLVAAVARYGKALAVLRAEPWLKDTDDADRDFEEAHVELEALALARAAHDDAAEG